MKFIVRFFVILLPLFVFCNRELHVESHPEVSVLFADIVNFTPLTASLSASNLVSMLNELFGQFDEVAKVNIQKEFV